MLSRMELYGEHIDLKTGHVTIDANNMKLDAAGNATFSGTITGGTMHLGNNFAVDASAMRSPGRFEVQFAQSEKENDGGR